MKNLCLSALLLAFPFILLAQNIHGLWSGTLVNDSTHRTQNFELGLSEYRGKITGYTYTTFIENDTFYYSVKRIKAERRDGKLVIEDVQMVGNNFPERAAKHVKQITTFPLINDTTIDITNGRWTTNQTKKYYSIGGSAKVKEQEEEKGSDLLSHLQEMKVRNDIVVKNKEKKDESLARTSPTVKTQPNKNDKPIEKKNNDVVKNSASTPSQQKMTKEPLGTKQPDVAKNTQPSEEDMKPASRGANDKNSDETKATVEEARKTTIAAGNNAENNVSTLPQNTNYETIINNKRTVQQNVPTNTNAAVNVEKTQTATPEKKQAVVEPTIQKSSSSSNTNGLGKEKIINTVSANTPVSQKKETIEKLKELPAAVAVRKNESIQDIYFKNDSLVLSLYDNGIVDGDTVSVFVNGENIISRQKLKEAATKKTIYISAITDSVQLVLFAENLGTIPPNTGLLTVRDGDDVYQVRFSADLQKNASLFLRRKKD